MHAVQLRKVDGRALTLYARQPMAATDPVAPSPFSEPLRGHAHLRWHPLRGEWVTYAAHRQDRTFLPPPEYDPLAATVAGAAPTELPGGDWDVAVFDNRFPALGGRDRPEDRASDVAGLPQLEVPTALAGGHCEVVVYTPDRLGSLGTLALDHLELILSVWADRTRRLAARDDVAYVFPFENRGAEVGATLSHPHGQIYAYPVVPPVPARIAEQSLASLAAHGRGALDLMVEAERRSGQRLVYDGPHAVAFVPVCARYPYEAWVAPIVPVARFSDLDPAQRADLARALKTVLMKYDGLWQRPMPYLMVWYQAPTDGLAHPEAHLHAQFYPSYRSRDRLKYLAGTEIGAGFFAMDVLPEDTARELQAVPVSLD
ncbi:MAG: galactose-1-phosphate uridylyltransferase [Pseudomonadota bacterium]|nr:galactose-1-phosphate uridylyltransferase [Pseudomonadota bacterium]